jgi:hypothetical protein
MTKQLALLLIAASLCAPAIAQQPYTTPEEKRIYEQLAPSLQAADEAAGERYKLEVQQFGKHAVDECRSRMSRFSDRYSYCLEANRRR